MSKILHKKISRLYDGFSPRTLDMFCGAGGLSLGFHRAGSEIISAVEIDTFAAATHERNFGHLNPNYKIYKDVTKHTPAQLVGHCTQELDCRELVDFVIGGPPCQPFTPVGRAKLREVAGDPEAYVNDERVSLYTRFMAAVEELEPIAFVMENVKDIGRFKGRNIPEEIAVEAEDIGYNVRYAIINAAWYGVPQMRERMIVIGIHKDLGLIPEFPLRQHDLILPKGYTTSRNGNGRPDVCSPWDHYVKEIPVVPNPKPPATAWDGLADLPKLKGHLEFTPQKGPRKFDLLAKYIGPPFSEYAKLMREWPGFESIDGVYDHVIRYTPRDYPIFKKMKPGDQYPQAYTIALQLFEEKIRNLEKSLGRKIYPEDDIYKEIMEKTVPPYDILKYPNKWRKMEADLPSRTLMAHLGKDSYSHIHYDSDQARSISVREAARLQSFPDGFVFEGAMNAAFRQIGNAVPPLMAYVIARKLLSDIHSASVKNKFAGVLKPIRYSEAHV